MRKWEENIRKVMPYTPGEQPNEPDMVKLNTNENPYPPSPKVAKALREIRSERLRLYPDPKASRLVHALADHYGLHDNQVFVGVGSDDVLAMIFMTFFNGEKPILFPDITYSFYDVWADMLRIPYEQVPLTDDFRMDINDYDRDNGGIVIANPNAPTGVLLSMERLTEIIRHNQDSIIVIDEAYIDFGAMSAVPLIEKYDNIIVVQTFSKSRSLASMRIGYAMAQPQLIAYLNDVKYSFNSYTMDITAIEAGVAALQDVAYYRGTIDKIKKTRQWTADSLRRLGFTFEESVANFLFVTHPEVSAEKIFEILRENHIYVRHWDKERISEHLRITIGTQREMEHLINELTEIVR